MTAEPVSRSCARYSGKVSKRQSMPARSASSDMPSTCVRFCMVRSRSAGRHGAIVKPQLPITAVVTPRAGDGARVGSQVICASKWVWLSTIPGISARPSASTVRAASTAPSARATARDAAARDRDVAAKRLAARAVDDERVAKDEVDHARLQHRGREQRFHLAPQPVRRGGRVHRDVAPGEALSFRDRPRHLDVVRQAERQPADAGRRLRPARACPTPCSRPRRRARRRASGRAWRWRRRRRSSTSRHRSASPRSATLATETPTSRPIRCQRL